MVWGLTLLVQDPLEAATCVLKFGYHRTAPDARFLHYSDFTESSVRLLHPESTEAAVTLLPARD